MSFEYLQPIDASLLAYAKMQSNRTFGQSIVIHFDKSDFPDLTSIKIAIIGVREGRGAVGNYGTGSGFDAIRRELYSLYPGNWPIKIADLGDIEEGASIEDTYFALGEVVAELVKMNIIPLILGGSQDLTYANYRAYDKLEQTVNLVSVDSRFNIGAIEDELNADSFLSKIVMNKPNNLFNFSNIGYQTFYNSQDEIDLLDSLFFDAYRLGEVIQDITLVEPTLRDADIVSIDTAAIRFADAPANNNATPNGFSGAEMCSIARYAGISDKVSSFGIYEYNEKYDIREQTAKLLAQLIWYFVEGVNFRAHDYPFDLKDKHRKYIVPIEDQELYFHKSNKSGRWWMEINLHGNNKFMRHALIPCTYQDYVSATNQEIPDRWIKTLKKLI